MLRWAVCCHHGPVAIRYPRGSNRGLTESCWTNQPQVDKNGLLYLHKPGCDVMIVTYGVMLEHALIAADLLEQTGIRAGVIRLLSVAPLPVQALAQCLHECRYVMVVEECCTGAGIKETLAWQLKELVPSCRVDGMDLGSAFVRHGDLKTLYQHYGLDGISIADRIREVIQVEK